MGKVPPVTFAKHSLRSSTWILSRLRALTPDTMSQNKTELWRQSLLRLMRKHFWRFAFSQSSLAPLRANSQQHVKTTNHTPDLHRNCRQNTPSNCCILRGGTTQTRPTSGNYVEGSAMSNRVERLCCGPVDADQIGAHALAANALARPSSIATRKLAATPELSSGVRSLLGHPNEHALATTGTGRRRGYSLKRRHHVLRNWLPQRHRQLPLKPSQQHQQVVTALRAMRTLQSSTRRSSADAGTPTDSFCTLDADIYSALWS
jgi:hypothetical protein